MSATVPSSASESSSSVLAASASPPATRVKKPYVPAVGPRLRVLLVVVFALTAALGANSLYLAGVTALEWWTGLTYQDLFYQYMFLLHLALGLAVAAPFLAFAAFHLRATFRRKNKNAVRMGYALFTAGLLVLVSGLLLTRFGWLDLKSPPLRAAVYWLHVLSPLGVVWLYVLHRLAGPPIRWRVAAGYLAVVGALVVAALFLHAHDPRRWNEVGPAEGDKYFEPSLARTSTGKFIPAEALMHDNYCKSCHPDVYQGWFHSAHRFSSFNNPAYTFAVRETRKVALARDGDVKAARWCAGCHDPAPFFSGAFDDPKFDDVKHPTAHAGITCTTCHAITHVHGTRGNAEYTIEEPLHYPFAYSDNPWLLFLNQQLVKAKPAFHKKTFLKPFHKTAEFCSTCHKVHIPDDINHYKEFLRGQNHYDSFLLSGVSGHGARSFYYPPKAATKCADCHMPLQASSDFGAQDFGKTGELTVHGHLFPGANTGLPFWRDEPNIVAAQQAFLKGVMRVDIFALKEGDRVDAAAHAPLRPQTPTLEPGKNYLLDVVIRTLKMGHHFTQGTVDSNEVWVEVVVKSGDRVIGVSGQLDARREVDPWAHFVNVFMLDREGNRVDRRNVVDIFTPLYDHQIPPGAAAVAHYDLRVPPDVTEPISVEVKLNYRKFDQRYVEHIVRGAGPNDAPLRAHPRGETVANHLPITVLAEDRLTFGVGEQAAPSGQPIAGPAEFPLWQRWNDYGIALLLEGQAGAAKGELKQAAAAFAEVERLGRFDGPLNLARTHYTEGGDLDAAVDALRRVATFTEPAAPPWTVSWLTGLVNRQQGHLDKAIQNFEDVLKPTAERQARGFDFSKDYVVINELGLALFERAKQEIGADRADARRAYLRRAAEQFEKTLALDVENVPAHYNLAQIYNLLDDAARAERHRAWHLRYKPDDNARDRALALARQKYPAANKAAEPLVIYPLRAPEAPAP